MWQTSTFSPAVDECLVLTGACVCTDACACTDGCTCTDECVLTFARPFAFTFAWTEAAAPDDAVFFACFCFTCPCALAELPCAACCASCFFCWPGASALLP